MNPEKPLLLVTIDTECDKSPNWYTAAPLAFRGVTEGIPRFLQPLFESWGIRPTYLLSPEVILDLECREVLAALKDVELGAHLHGDTLAPRLKTWDLAGTITDEMQWEYSPELEREKLETLTHLFRQQFDSAPKAFRAGRFGIGHHSGRWLQELGYQVDSSVTPHVAWRNRAGELFPDFRGFPEQPYRVERDGDIWKPGGGSLLEVPVTILNPGVHSAPQAQDPIWFRPWYSAPETLLEILEWVAAQPPQGGHRRPLVMMFHNVEIIPGASPYPQTPADVQRYIDALKRVFERAEKMGLQPATLSEYAQVYEHEMAGRAMVEEMLPTQSRIRRSAEPLSAELTIPAPSVEAALARHKAPAWFGYIYRERATRWDVWKPCVWIAQNYSPEARVLSTGCGVGFNLLWLAEHGFRNLYGFDIDPSTIGAAQELSEQTGHPLHLWVDDGLRPQGLPAEKFEVIEALNWTYLLAEYGLEEFLDQYLPHLSEEGVLILDAIDTAYHQVPNNQYLTSDWQKPEIQRKPTEYKVRFSEEQVRSALEARCFQLVEILSEQQLIPKRVYIAARTAAAGRFSEVSGEGRHDSLRQEGRATPGSPACKARILLIADVPNWIFERHCRTLQSRLSDEFDFTLKYMNEPYNEEEYDLIYPLEWFLVRPEWIRSPRKYVTGIRSHDSWRQHNPADFARYLAAHFGRVHVVSQRLFEIFRPLLPGVVYVTHGVDAEFFAPAAPVRSAGRKLRLGWAGNRLKAMSPSNKGFADFIEPLGRLPGVELVFCGYSDRNLTMEEMREFYNSIDAYVCASQFEGSNNSLLEAAAMERAILTTDNGTVPEYLVHQRSALIVPRQLPEFITAVEYLRDHPKKRLSLGKAAREAVAPAWDWKTRAEDYRRFFQEALAAAGWGASAQAVSLEALLRQAEACFAAEDLAGAARDLSAALELSPDSPELIVAYGNILLRQGNVEGARRAFVKATVLAPGNAPACLNLAAVQALLGQAGEALATTRRALTLDPGNAEALKLLGRLCLEREQYSEGVGAYLGVLRQNPRDVEALLALGTCYSAVDDRASAELLYRQALQVEPENPAARAVLQGLGCSLEPGEANCSPDDGMAKGLPQVVHFLLNDKCNAKCVMCGGDYARSTSGRRITFEKFERMAENLGLERFTTAILSGAGDPLLNPDLVKIIRFLNRRYPKLRVAITTNGIALSARLSNELLECRLDHINISINAATRSTYQRIMQVDCFDKVIKNIRTFAARRAEKRAGPALQLSSAINRLNIRELPALVELARELGVQSINVLYCRFYPERIRHQNIEQERFRLDDSESLFFHQELSDEMVEKAARLANQSGIRFSHEPLFKEHAGPKVCRWPEAELMVGFDGEVYPCGGGELHFKGKVEGGIYRFGNALEERLEDFWNSAGYRALRISSHQQGRYLIPECRSCANLIAPGRVESHLMQWDEPAPELPAGEISLPPVLDPVENAGEPERGKPPLVSVIVPTYNRPEMLVESIQSVLEQTFQDFEILVVNDAGVEVGAQVEALNRSGKITYLAHGANRGLGAARNTGIRNARGKYIAYLDDDDRFYPQHLETLVNFLENSDYEVAYTDAYQAHQRRENGRYVTFQKVLAFSHDFDAERLLVQNYTPVLCVMHARHCALEAGLFDETLSVYEDWDLWIRISHSYPFAHLPQITCEFTWRVDGSTMSSSRDGFQRLLPVIYERYRDYAQGKPQILEAQARFLEQAAQVMRQREALKILEEIFKQADRGAAIEASRDRLSGEMVEILRLAAERERQAGNLSKAQELEAVAGEVKARLDVQAGGQPADGLGDQEVGRRSVESSRIDIVIPVYGQPQLVRRCVDSLMRTVSGAQIMLVNDASPDETTRRLLDSYAVHPAITVIHRANNAGFIGATRQGAEAGKAPFILFLNSDIEALEPGWLERMIPEAEDIAIVGAKLLFPADIPGPLAGRVQHAGIARQSGGWPFHPFLGQVPEYPAVNARREVNAVTGACFLVRRRVWDELGGWDERFGRGVYEDVDLCWQARQRGYRVLYEPAATLLHRESASREIDGDHKLHAHSRENVEKLRKKWSFLRSDEELFVGKKDFKRYEQARTWMHKARKALERKQLAEVVNATRRAYKTAPDLPEAVIGYAQVLSVQGKPIEAAELFEQSLQLDPKNWQIWLRLIDEWQKAGQPDRAASWLSQLQAMFPNDPKVLERKASLAAWMPAAPPQPAPAGPGPARWGEVPTPSVKRPATLPETAVRRAAETLAFLLEADDLPAALQQQADRLDAELLAVVRAEAGQAWAAGDRALAEGLDDLAAYVERVVAARPAMAGNTPARERTGAAETLARLLEAEDLPAALRAYADRLDSDLLTLVRSEAVDARAGGEVELAEGLESLAEYVQALIVRPARLPA